MSKSESSENLIVYPSRIEGTCSLPPSKSHTIRAVFLASLAQGTSTIKNPLKSKDTLKMVEVCRAFGAVIDIKEEVWTIQGIGGDTWVAFKDVIDVGNSGLVFRFLTALAPALGVSCVITGDESIRTRRPIRPLTDALEVLGAKVKFLSSEQNAPLWIEGKIQSGKVTIEGPDSQPLSALLLVSPLVKGRMEVTFKNPGEKPWVQLTLSWLKRMDIEVQEENLEKFIIEGGQGYKAFSYSVPKDLSHLSHLITLSYATKSRLKIDIGEIDPDQGDGKMLASLEEMGAKISYQEGILEVDGTYPLLGGSVDISLMVDTLPAWAVIGVVGTKNPLFLENALVTRSKESDRIGVMARELRKMGAYIEEFDEGMRVFPGILKGGKTLITDNDHRVAMSLIGAALSTDKETRIEGVSCIDKAYPDFLKTVHALSGVFTKE